MGNKIYKNYIRYLESILPGGGDEKSRWVLQHIAYMLCRTESMFKWRGLPDTIPAHVLELYLQTNGNVCFYRYSGELYVFTGGMGGAPDVYYRPTTYTIANPALNISKILKIDEECTVMYSDMLSIGLLPLYEKYGMLISEAEISAKIALINSRIVELITAPDDRTKKAAEKYISDMVEGKYGVIADNAFFEGIKTQPYGGTGSKYTMTSIIEMIQYLKASLYNDIGLNANYNMKREALTTTESQMNNDALLPYVDHMLKCRKDGAARVNRMYGTNISVDFASSWADNQEEIELAHETIANNHENVKTHEAVTKAHESVKDNEPT